MLKKISAVLICFLFLILSCAVPASAAGRYFNTGEVLAAEWGLEGVVFSPYDSTTVVDMGSYYEFSITGLSLGETAYFALDVNVGNLTIYDTETLHGLVNLDIYSGGGGFQLGRSMIMLYETTTFETGGPAFDAIGVTPEGSLPSRELIHMQIGFDMAMDLTFDRMQVQFQYKKSRAFDDVIRVYKTSTFQLYTGSLDSELLSEMVDEQRVTNEKLDELIGQAEREKDEATDTGNDGVGEITDVIPDHSSGFISGMENLVTSLSYSGTDCKWTFPQLYIPAIEGVTGEIKLTDSEFEIDIGGWVKKIPGTILSVIQIILTIALILFCVKELYGTVQYILTLKGGGA